MTAKKSTIKKTKSKVRVKKVKDRRLLDDRLLAGKRDNFSVYLTIIFLIFLLFVFSLFIYFFFLRNQSPSENFTPDIVVPESALEELQQQEEEEQAAEEEQGLPVVEVLTVRVLDTPTDFLNVRTGPSTSFSLIGQVFPGDSFEYVSENELGSWYEIRLASGNTGWVFAQYAELVTEQRSVGQ